MTAKLQVEAWSLPGVGTFERTITRVPYLSVSLPVPVSGVARGELVLAAAYDRINELLDPAVGEAFIVVKQQPAPGEAAVVIGSFYARGGSGQMGEQANQAKTLTGPDAGDVMAHAVLYNYDHPAYPSVQQDWEWGSSVGAGSYTNGDMEAEAGDSDFEDQQLDGWGELTASDVGTLLAGPEVIDTDPYAGTYHLSFETRPGQLGGVAKTIAVEPGGRYQFTARTKAPAGTRVTIGLTVDGTGTIHHTNGYTFNGRAMAEVGNAAKGAGASNGTTYDLTSLDVTLGADQEQVTVEVRYEETLGDVVYLDAFTTAGPRLGLVPWKAVALLGGTSTIEQDSGVFYGGANAMKVTTNSVTGFTCGAYQVVDGLMPGTVYTFAAWVRQDSGSTRTMRAIIGRTNGGWYNHADFSVPTGTWTLVRVTTLVDADSCVPQVRDQQTGALTWWMDEATFATGLPAATAGQIMGALMDDAQTDHTAEIPTQFARQHLTFVKPTFTDSLDSAGNAWPTELLQLRLRAGWTYQQCLTELGRLGYEWRVEVNPNYPTDTEPLVLHLWQPWDPNTYNGGQGTDRSNDASPMLGKATGVIAGPITEASPGRNTVLSRGAAGIFNVREDTASQALVGRRELSIDNRDALDLATVNALGDQAVAERAAGVVGGKLTMHGGLLVPFDAFGPGDTVQSEWAPTLAKGARRVVQILLRVAGDGHPQYDVDLSAVQYQGQAGTAEAVRRLLAKPERHDELSTAAVAAAGVAAQGPPIENSFLVALAGARQAIKDVADFVCDGVEDWDEILAAVSACGTWGRVVVSAGVLTDETTRTITIPDGVLVEGSGKGVSEIDQPTGTWTMVVAGGIRGFSMYVGGCT